MERFKAILQRKVGGIPVWVLFAIGILGLAFYLRKRQGEKGISDQASLADTANQTFPNAQAMPISFDTFVNITNPVNGTTSPGAVSLAAPTGVSQANSTSNMGLLTWNAVPGAAGYRIYQQGGGLINAGQGTSLWIPGLSSHTKYGYQVAAVDAQGNVGPKSEVAFITTK